MTNAKKFKKPQNIFWHLYLDLAKKSQKNDVRREVERLGYMWHNMKQTISYLPVGRIPAELFKPLCKRFGISEEDILNPQKYDKYGNDITKNNK